MKHLAAYLLLNLAGKTPNESSIKSLLDTVGIETDSARLKQLLGELDGKDIDEKEEEKEESDEDMGFGLFD
ncbi:16009_t:CDS:2 [Rhizophagus irregularis]|nr:16009_t:CDS:2 [Rhizophagus irregularis]